MSDHPELVLGALTRTIRDRARWELEAGFPGSQIWADEIERVLGFLESQGVFPQFLPRFRDSRQKRDAAFAEARVGFFFHRNGFKILSWWPRGLGNHLGDLEIQWCDTEPIFVEVKGPTWESELSPQERASGRKSQPKVIHAEVRSARPSVEILYAIDRALPKFLPSRANLVAVVDDLFLSPLDHYTPSFEQEVETALVKSKYAELGGVILFNAVCFARTESIEYRKRFIVNRNAIHPLPNSVLLGFGAGNSDPVGPWWIRP